ncbi:hypothetical protein Tco_0079007 [Tanacetum coccineum]
MSDSVDSTATYTEVSSPFEDLSDIGSPGVIIHGYNGLTMMPEDLYTYVEDALQAPPSPDYVPGPEEPEQAPPSPDFIPEPVYPEFMPPEDDVLPAEEQPLPAAVSPTADSPADYPTDRDDDDDEDEEESSGDDADNEEQDEDEDKKEEKENLALADFVLPPACCTTARMPIRDQTPIPFPFAAKVDRFLAISTPPSSPLTSYSSLVPHIPSPPLLVSSPLPISPPPLPASPTHPLDYRAAMIRLRVESPFTSHQLPLPLHIILPYTRASMAMMRAAVPSTYILAPRLETPPSGTPPLLLISLPTTSPPLLLPSTNYRADVPEVTLLPRNRLCIAPGPRYEVGESSFAPTARPTGGFRADYDETAEEIPATDVAELGQRMTNFVTTVRQDTNEIYGRLDDAQDDRSLMSGQLKFLRRDMCSHARTTRLMKSEARASREAWVQSMDASDMARSETQMAALQSQQTPARDPAHPDVPEEAGSSS